ncbi:alpha/beta fold hydrolase [Gluconacetobacter takamatsuzukensis]|uniref:Alpha/beta hydrolase n=1 Tax=Gluconacetobacter takamatsuzukensis TaxID=1286190 RepID=A0A7W4KBG5_9PROT|nr:alpha/beta hydrolase [Gluconacetobacter takamatsuzukensis]MBB2203877.1 alpha/beta hydrolase [Gluconacetobacter takamatsuzukensis]
MFPVFRTMFSRLCVLPVFSCALAHAAPAASPPVRIDGRIAVSTSGVGPDVLLIPGLASSADVWRATVAHLAPHYRVHVVQVLGFAGTPVEANATGPVIAPVVAALHDYIATRHLQPVRVIGHSMGGLMGMLLALDHAPDIGRLMIVDALPFFGVVMGAADVASIEPRAHAMRAHLLDQTQQELAAAQPAFMKNLVRSTGPAAAAAVAASAASDHRVVGQALYDDMTTDLRGRIGAITVPVTMLYPWDETAGMPAAAVDQLYRTAFAPLKQAELKRIDDSRHFIMIDQPAAFQAAVDTFLAR